MAECTASMLAHFSVPPWGPKPRRLPLCPLFRPGRKTISLGAFSLVALRILALALCAPLFSSCRLPNLGGKKQRPAFLSCSGLQKGFESECDAADRATSE